MRTFILVVSLFSFPVTAVAAPAYGTRMPESRHATVGLQAYNIFYSKLEKDYGKISSLQHFGLLTLGIFDWLCLDLKGGAGHVHSRNAAAGDINYTPFLGGGYGFRVRVLEHEQTKAVIGFQHISIHPYSKVIGNGRNKAVLDDWQFSGLVSYELKALTPYIGGRWSRVDHIHWINDQRKREQPVRTAGLITGFDIPLNAKTWLNIEGQFLDATAVAASINFSF